jgi:hypothetical protein
LGILACNILAANSFQSSELGAGIVAQVADYRVAHAPDDAPFEGSPVFGWPFTGPGRDPARLDKDAVTEARLIIPGPHGPAHDTRHGAFELASQLGCSGGIASSRPDRQLV